MATTWAELTASGVGRIVVLLEITGFRYVLTTDDIDPTGESWYDDEGYADCKAWLKWDVGPVDETFDPVLGFLKLSDLSVSVTDIGGGMTAEIKSREELNPTPITESVDVAETTIYVASHSGYSAGDIVYLGQEAIKVGATGTDEGAPILSGCTRDYLGTVDAKHTLSFRVSPHRQPFVTSGPVRLAGRPCRIRVAVINEATGTAGACAVVWRGIVGEEIRVSPEAWDIPLVHITTALSRSVGRGLYSSGIKPHTYWYAGST